MSWRFARRPSWILRHVLVIVLVAVMVSLGLWQLRRLEARQDHIALLEARQRVPAAEVRAVIPTAPIGSEAVDEVLYRTVSATGTYDSEGTVTVANRSYEGTPGGWVLTPLVLDDGTAVVVNRGFVGFDRAGDLRAPPPPEGTVTVRGVVQASQERGSFGPTDPDEGRLDQMARADLARLAAQLDHPILPAYVQLERSDPPELAADPATAGGTPVLVHLGVPTPDEGPHLSYAVQWFIFSTIALVGYPLLLRRVAQGEARGTTAADPDRARPERDRLDDELAELLRSE